MTSNSFYDDLLTKIKQAITEENFKEATRLIDDELSMPYTPAPILIQLKQLERSVRASIRLAHVPAGLSKREFLANLCGPAEQCNFAITQSEQFAFKPEDIDAIQFALDRSDIDPAAKYALFEQLIEQQFARPVLINATLAIPAKTLPLSERPFMKNAIAELQELTFKSPYLLGFAEHFLVNYTCSIFPADVTYPPNVVATLCYELANDALAGSENTAGNDIIKNIETRLQRWAGSAKS